LSDSLLFAFRKFKQVPEPIHCVVTAEIGRNADNRLRVLNMTAEIRMGALASALDQVEHVLAQFEEFCTVTQSVRQGIPVTIQVFDGAGVQLK
jgi:organic hydroperoxide reductase OsmC/OhrA